MSAVCLLSRLVGSLHLETSATERANIELFVLLCRSLTKTLQMLEEAYGKTAMKKAQVYG
jgi:hypothetical protein